MGRTAIIDQRSDLDPASDRVRKRASGSAKDKVTHGGSDREKDGFLPEKDRCPSLHIRYSNIIIFIYKNINNILLLYYYIDMILY